MAFNTAAAKRTIKGTFWRQEEARTCFTADPRPIGPDCPNTAQSESLRQSEEGGKDQVGLILGWYFTRGDLENKSLKKNMVVIL